VKRNRTDDRDDSVVISETVTVCLLAPTTMPALPLHSCLSNVTLTRMSPNQPRTCGARSGSTRRVAEAVLHKNVKHCARTRTDFLRDTHFPVGRRPRSSSRLHEYTRKWISFINNNINNVSCVNTQCNNITINNKITHN
jgi:hypothetical protein